MLARRRSPSRRTPLNELLLRIHGDCDAGGLPKPNWRTLKRRIDQLDDLYDIEGSLGAVFSDDRIKLGRRRRRALPLRHDEAGVAPLSAISQFKGNRVLANSFKNIDVQFAYLKATRQKPTIKYSRLTRQLGRSAPQSSNP